MGQSRDTTRGLGRRILARGSGFRSEFIDFERGIRMGHLEPAERITQILKRRLEERHAARMVCDRWGRGVYWQWICWVPDPNRKAKPRSSGFNFASSKFFIAVDREARVFQSGMQIERAPSKRTKRRGDVFLDDDWDWHVFLRAVRGKRLPRELRRLLGEGFRIRVGEFDRLEEYRRRDWSLARFRKTAEGFDPASWGGFQLYWPMPEREVQAATGSDIIEATAAVFDEVSPAMNLCMVAPCLRDAGEAGAD